MLWTEEAPSNPASPLSPPPQGAPVPSHLPLACASQIVGELRRGHLLRPVLQALAQHQEGSVHQAGAGVALGGKSPRSAQASPVALDSEAWGPCPLHVPCRPTCAFR